MAIIKDNNYLVGIDILKFEYMVLFMAHDDTSSCQYSVSSTAIL